LQDAELWITDVKVYHKKWIEHLEGMTEKRIPKLLYQTGGVVVSATVIYIDLLMVCYFTY
jgi:hypothetical protein